MKNLFFLLVILMGATLISCAPKAADEAPATTAADTTKAAPGPVEFADPHYTDIGRKSLSALSSGDIEGMMANYAENAVYRWNNGDSLAGKKAIHDYWMDRRTKLIDSLTFSEEIYLPVNVNKPQANEQAGVWLLSWYRTNAKYKTGKKMNQWMHSVMHFDANDKIDQVLLYRDNAPIIAATAK